MPSLVVVRASDGAGFPLFAQDLVNIHTLDDLRLSVLSPLLAIAPDAIIPMSSTGNILRDDSVRELVALVLAAGGERSASRAADGAEEEHRVFVFDRELLDADPDAVAQALAIAEEDVLNEPPLNPEDPISAHIALSLHNLDTLRALIHSIALQRASLQVALSNLLHVISPSATSFDRFVSEAGPNLSTWGKLLEGLEPAMDAIGQVSVIGVLGPPKSAHSRDASAVSLSATTRERFLSDYVSKDKMLAVRDGCAKVLVELSERTDELQATIDAVTAGAGLVQEEFDATSRDLEDLAHCENDAETGHDQVEELVHAGADLTDPDLRADNFEELSVCDAEARDRIRFLVERKNAMTRYLILSMQKVSSIQSDIAEVPNTLGALDYDFKTRTENFKHLARLEIMIPSYVATVAEVVRRREFTRLLSEHSTALSQSLGPLSALERGRRSHYRATYAGKLPWEVKGLAAGTEESIPELDLAIRHDTPELPRLGRDALEAVRKSLADVQIEGDNVEHPIRLAMSMADELLAGFDAVDADFAKLTQPGATADPPNAPSVEELTAQLRLLEEAKEEEARAFQSERTAHEEGVAQLNQQNSELAAAREADAKKIEELAGQVEGASTRTKTLEKDLGLAQSNAKALQSELVALRGQLAKLESEHKSLQADHTQAKSSLEQLGSQTRSVEASHRELAATLAEKDKLLRDQRGEAELDRAVLEKELVDADRALKERESDLRVGEANRTALEEIAKGLREQIVRWEISSQEKDVLLEEGKKELEAVRKQREVALVEGQRDAVKLTATVRSALKLAGSMASNAHQIVALLNAPPVKSDSSTEIAQSALQPEAERTPSPPRAVVSAEADKLAGLDYDAGDLDSLLAELNTYEPSALSDAVRIKVDGLSALAKKWVKEAKAYRERAHRATASAGDKIAFRNFAKGDLALFLPTRNATVPVWAAFNVSFPHHFLAASGVVAEQMKTREWIVARITNLSERVVDLKDPESNPYGLAAGTKFFLLEVEAWSSKEASTGRTRKHSTAEKDKGKERRRVSRSESNPHPPASSSSVVLVDAPSTPPSAQLRRSVSESGAGLTGLPTNATALARSEFATVEEDVPAEEAEAEAGDSHPPSPTTLRQNVPRSDEVVIPDRVATSPSALSRALAARQPSSADPFAPTAANPFASTQTPPVASSPPRTEYESVASGSSAAAAFLPARSNASSASNSRYPKSANLTVGPSIPRAVMRKAQAGTSPGSATSGSFVAFPRSASSGSSLLSASMMHRRGNPSLSHPRGDALTGSVSSPSAEMKSLATSEAQLADSRWNVLTSDLSAATRDHVRPALAAKERAASGTARRSIVGFPSAGTGPDRDSPTTGSGPKSSSRTMLDSIMGAGGKRGIESWGPREGASEIRKKLGGAGTGAK